jgi:hypothetical protein
MSDVIMRQGDTRPYLDCTLKDANGARDLTGETVRFVMKSSGDTIVINESSTGSQVTLVNTTGGQVRYAWSTSDTDTPGDFLGDWEATDGSGDELTFPNVGHIEITITPELST